MRLIETFHPFLKMSLTKEIAERPQSTNSNATIRRATRTKSRFLWAWVMTGRWPESSLHPFFMLPFIDLLDIFQIHTYVCIIILKNELETNLELSSMSWVFLPGQLRIINRYAKIHQIISVIKRLELVFPEKWYFKNSSFWHFDSHFVLKHLF